MDIFWNCQVHTHKIMYPLLGAASPVSHGMHHRVGSPGLMPRPAQPILPRDRTAMDKVGLLFFFLLWSCFSYS